MTSKKPININAEMEKANMRMERKALGTSKSDENCSFVERRNSKTDEMPKAKKLFLVKGTKSDIDMRDCIFFDEAFPKSFVELTPSDLELIKEELTGRIVFTPEQFQKEIDKIPQKEALLKKLEMIK